MTNNENNGSTARLHDPEKTLSDLRDHLSRHDKPIAFLFGAGTSCAVRVPGPCEASKTRPLIPAVEELTQVCKSKASELGDKYAKAWGLIEQQCQLNGRKANIEDLLSRFRIMRTAIGSGDTLCGLNGSEIACLERLVRRTIAEVVNPDLEALSDEWPHRKFAKWMLRISRQKAVEVFTLNYDVLLEHALELERVPVFDGFVGTYRPFFHADAVRRKEAAPGENWARLWKLHGSVTWKRIFVDGIPRVIRQEPHLDGEMIYPSFEKYHESRQLPYSAFTDRLSRFLEQDGALLVTAGFNFGDEHINNVVFRALESSPRTHVYALQFIELSDQHDAIKSAGRLANLSICGPETGVIGGVRGKWAYPGSVAFKDMIGKAESTGTDGCGDANGATVECGTMKLVDFALFCDFLENMTGR